MDGWPAVKRKVDAALAEYNKISGALDHERRAFQKKYGCKSFAEAKALMEKRTRKEVALAKEWGDALDAFQERYKKQLGG